MPRIIKQDTTVKTNRFSKKTAIIVAVSALVVAGVSLAAWYMIDRSKTSNQQSAEEVVFLRRSEQLKAADAVGGEASVAAQKALDDKEVAEFERIYHEAIAEHADAPSVQVNLYVALAQGLVALKQDAKALLAAQQAYELDDEQMYSRVTLPLIGYAAYRLGDKALALDYLRKTYDQQKNDQYLESGVLKETEDFITQLEGEL